MLKMSDKVANKFYTAIWYSSSECSFNEHKTIKDAIDHILNSHCMKFKIIRGQEVELTLQVKEREKKVKK
jgi:hypothetical protein